MEKVHNGKRRRRHAAISGLEEAVKLPGFQVRPNFSGKPGIVRAKCKTTKALTWEDVLADRSLRNLPYKIETNRHHQIMMSPAAYWQSDYQLEIAALLRQWLPGGRAPVECAIQTAEGVRVTDASWISRERRAPHRRSVVLPIAPDICVEVLSLQCP